MKLSRWPLAKIEVVEAATEEVAADLEVAVVAVVQEVDTVVADDEKTEVVAADLTGAIIAETIVEDATGKSTF
jgi:hypothetical protein